MQLVFHSLLALAGLQRRCWWTSGMRERADAVHHHALAGGLMDDEGPSGLSGSPGMDSHVLLRRRRRCCSGQHIVVSLSRLSAAGLGRAAPPHTARWTSMEVGGMEKRAQSWKMSIDYNAAMSTTVVQHCAFCRTVVWTSTIS